MTRRTAQAAPEPPDDDDEYDDDEYDDDEYDDDGGVYVISGRHAEAFIAGMFGTSSGRSRRRARAGNGDEDQGDEGDEDAEERAAYERLHAKYGPQANTDEPPQDPPSQTRGHRYFERRNRDRG